MTKQIPLKAITITYTKTCSFVPERWMFEDWDVEPTQEGFESHALDHFFDILLDDVGRDGSAMDYTDVRRFEDVVVQWGDE